MLKLLKYLKQSTIPIVLVILLLVIQANCDLSLPQYTSDIVNVGIQQGGIKQVAPTVIRESQMNKLLLFVTEKQKNNILDNYELLNKDSLSKKDYNHYVDSYPLLKKESLYRLDTKADDKIDKLSDSMGKALLIVYSLDSNTKESIQMQEQIRSKLPDNTKELDIFTILSQMPKEQLAKILEASNEKMENMPESIVNQSAISILKTEYDVIGINVDQIQTNYIIIAGIKMLLLALLSMVATIAVGFLGARIAALLGMNLRNLIFDKVISFSNNEFDKFSTASLITRSTNDIQQIQNLMVMLLRIVFYAPILGIGGVIKVLHTNTSMSWIIAVGVGALLILVLILFKIAMPKFKIMQKLVDRLNLVTREILTGLPVIRAFSNDKHEEERFDKANVDLTKTSLYVNRVMTFMMPIMTLIMNAITVLIVYKGAEGIDAGNMQVGDLMAFIQYTMQIIFAFLMLSMISIMLPRASVSASRIVEVLDTPSSIHDPKTSKPVVDSLKGYVEFKNVSFRYPNADEDVLSGINFTAKPGQTTAIIGSTGSGKSTLINLIPRFYDVTEGSVYVDGIDIREMTMHELHDKLGLVPQKGVLFSGTIDSNIRYGKQNATEEEMQKAVRIAQASDFIDEKSEKYNTEISQGGNNVSGGQKQRLSIARAIAKDPEIYIFDDSFSALDYKTDVALRKALNKEIGNSTVIIVAQRISTIINADQILVLDDGKIVGQGTHKELLKDNEVYKQIALSQLSKEELENE